MWRLTSVAPSLAEIEAVKVKFTGGPAFGSNGKLYVPKPGNIQYVGEPSPIIDRNWEELIWGK